MGKKPNTADFLRAMKAGDVPEPETMTPATPPAASQDEAPPDAVVHRLPQAQSPKGRGRGKPAKPSRAELKHFGGYLEDDTLEKIALLRVRLKLDNSELIKLAIDDLHRKHTAKRAFGDA